MESHDLLSAARPLLENAIGRVADLIRSATDVHQLIPGGTWSIQQTGAHLAVTLALYEELAHGGTSPYRSLARDACSAASQQRFADLPEDDPAKLARLMTDAVDRFLDSTARYRGDHPVTYHCDLPFDVAGLTGVLLGDAVLHGFDIAVALHRPWRITAEEAFPVLASYAPLYHLIVDPERTRGLDVAVAIDLRGGEGPFVARFRDGDLSFEEPGHDVDATLSADPVAFLMIGSGRLDRWAAMALGLVDVGGRRPDAAAEFPDFFAYP